MKIATENLHQNFAMTSSSGGKMDLKIEKTFLKRSF